MKINSIVMGNYYRHKNTPKYGWAKVLMVLLPHKGLNIHNYPIARCEWTVSKGELFWLIKYFKLADLIDVKEGLNEPVRED